VRAVRIARRAEAAVHAILCCHSSAACADFAALERAEILRNELWLAHLIAKLGRLADGVALTTAVHWNADWRECLVQVVRDNKPDLIVKSTHTHGSIARYLLKSSDWLLLRTALAPVLLLKNAGEASGRRILLALNLGVEDPVHQRLNERILTMARELCAEHADYEIHAVSAYHGHDRFIHPPELAERAGIPLDRAHCRPGTPDDVIVEVAEVLKPELVIIGTVSRDGFSALTSGNTAEQALDRLATDVLVATVAA